MSLQTYQPPEGFYDQPFHWIYDASALQDGQTYLNQSVYIQGGWGDFLLRRIVGVSTVVPANGGQYQIRDRSGNYLQSDPTFVSPGLNDFPIVPELLYPERSQIRFDLYDVLRLDPPIAGEYVQQQQLTFPEPPIDFGQSLVASSDGTLCFVGGDDGNEGPGRVEVFRFTDGEWIPSQTIQASDASDGDSFGYSLSYDGTTLAVGAPRSGQVAHGSVYLFTLQGGAWTQTQKLSPSAEAEAQDQFGASVHVSGSDMLIGAPLGSIGGTRSGAVYYFSLSGTWTQQQKFTSTGAALNDQFGWRVQFTGSTALISAPAVTGVGTEGAVYFFALSGTWSQSQKITGGSEAQFGYSIFLVDTTTAFVGSNQIAGGAVSVLSNNSPWAITQRIDDPIGSATFGYSVTGGDADLFAGAITAPNGGSILRYSLNGGTWSLNQNIVSTTGSAALGTAVFLPAGSTTLFGGDTTGEQAFTFIPITTTSIFKSQIAFMGVRRQAGKQPHAIRPYQYKPKYFTYVQTLELTAAVDSAGNTLPAQTVTQLITDYDFDLYDLAFSYFSPTGVQIPPYCAKIQLFDYSKNFTSNIPMLDAFWNGSPDSIYQNGAVNPALEYPRQSQIRLDVYSVLTPSQIPITMVIHFIGRNRIPC